MQNRQCVNSVHLYSEDERWKMHQTAKDNEGLVLAGNQMLMDLHVMRNSFDEVYDERYWSSSKSFDGFV